MACSVVSLTGDPAELVEQVCSCGVPPRRHRPLRGGSAARSDSLIGVAPSTDDRDAIHFIDTW
jgi:hypothetical protein